jgi:hypothetical protein
MLRLYTDGEGNSKICCCSLPSKFKIVAFLRQPVKGKPPPAVLRPSAGAFAPAQKI